MGVGEGDDRNEVEKEMKLEFSEIFREMSNYLVGALHALNQVIVAIGAILSFVLYPNAIYQVYALAVAVVVVLDLVTKYYAISVKNGGLANSIKTRKISSNSMWMGTRKKIVSYFVIMLLVGLSYHFETFLFPAEYIGSMAYLIMFLRESQSILENLIDAGYEDLDWLRLLLKNKSEDVLDKINVDEKEKKENNKQKKEQEKNEYNF